MRVLVIEPDHERRAFFVDGLARAGWESIVHDGPIHAKDLGGIDVVLAEVDSAVTSDWFEGVRAAGKPRAVLTSAVPGLLTHWRERGVATVRVPASSQAIVDVVSGAADTTPSSPFLDSVVAAAPNKLTQDVVSDLGHLTDLVASAARAPLALVTVIDGDRQHFLLQKGLDDDLALAGGTPKSWSFCRHVAESDAPLVVSDARQHPLLASSPLVQMGLVNSYAGMPIRSNGVVVGIVCALGPEVRRFMPAELAALRLAAELVEARLRTATAPPPSTPGPAESAPVVSRVEVVKAPGVPTPREKAPEGDAVIGVVLGDRYLVTAALGSGGMSHVYLARETTLGTLVAIKVLRRGDADQSLIDEARTIVNVRHPNIVQAHSWGRTPDGAFFLVLEYVRGRSLHQLVRDARAQQRWLPLVEVIAAVRDVAGALESLHAVGMIHGDVKPPNVLADASLDRRVLIDFGLAMRMPQGGPSPTGSWRVGAPATARVGGTPGFSAPEQFVADPPVVPAPNLDVYGLAALAYYLVLGRTPFGIGADQGRAGVRPAVFALPSKIRPDLPAALDAVFTRALSADARDRPPAPTNFADQLERALANRHPSRAAPAGEPCSRGEAFIRARYVVRELLGTDGERALASAMPAASRTTLEEARDPDAWYPASAYLDYLRSYARRAPLESLGAAAYRKMGPRELASMRIDRSPHTLVRAMQPGFHRLHDWARFTFTPLDTHAVAMTLHLPRELTAGSTVCTLVAGWTRAMLLAVRREVTVTHVKCLASSDDRCELQCRWKD